MRIYASKTSVTAALAVALCAASCAARRNPAPPPRGTPPPIVVVNEPPIVLRTNQRLELHALLAAAARFESPLPPALEPARAPYVRVLANDDDDAILRDTSRGLAACADTGCNLKSFADHGLESVFLRAESAFGSEEQEKRRRWTWTAIERARAAFDERAEGVLSSLAKDLGVTPGPVDIVAESPPVGPKGLLTPLLAARGPCFVQDTRIVDCVIVRSLLAKPEGFSERFFTVLVVHAVALTMTGLDPKHASVDRRAVAAAEPDMLDYVTRQWHGGPVTPTLERGYDSLRESRSRPDAPASH